MPVPTADICHISPIPQLGTSFLYFLSIGSGTQGGLLRGHTDRDDLSRRFFQQLGIGLLDEGMPMPQTDVHPVSTITRFIQLLLKFLRDCLCNGDSRRVAPGDSVSFPN